MILAPPITAPTVSTFSGNYVLLTRRKVNLLARKRRALMARKSRKLNRKGNKRGRR